MTILVLVHSPFTMWNIPPGHLECLRRDFPDDTLLHATNDAEGLRLIGEAEVAFSSQITRAHLLAAPRLRWIHSPTAGVGSMLFPEMIASPVVISNSRGMAADTMAEHVLAVTLAFFRRLPFAIHCQSRRVWAQDAISAQGNRTISSSRVLIVGLGAIGQAVARRMSMLGADIIGVRRHATGSLPEGVKRIITPAELHAELPEADIVVLSAPHTPETRNLIGGAELALMSHRAILVNVSRGRLVDEAALAAALAEGRIEGAALDVFRCEPLPADSPLWTLPNVLITPHTSGFRPDHWNAATAIFADNLRRYKAGEQVLNVVDKRAGY